MDTKICVPIGRDERFPMRYQSWRCRARCACRARASVLHPMPRGHGCTGRTESGNGPIFTCYMHMGSAYRLMWLPTLCGASSARCWGAKLALTWVLYKEKQFEKKVPCGAGFPVGNLGNQTSHRHGDSTIVFRIDWPAKCKLVQTVARATCSMGGCGNRKNNDLVGYLDYCCCKKPMRNEALKTALPHS